MPGLLLGLVGFGAAASAQVLPRPAQCDRANEWIDLRGAVGCEVEAWQPQVQAFSDGLRRLGVTRARIVDGGSPATIRFERTATEMAPEAYAIRDDGAALVVTSSSSAGVAYACATLLQLVDLENGGKRARLPRVTIKDRPQLPYRSFMVDMGRNPHSPAVLRQVVDAMWLCKANYLQLHLTDDQIGSWPSAAFPRIYTDRAGWTLAAFRELEAYSQARGVTIVPELDVPGHSTILRREYPEVFGKTPTDLASKPAAQRGVERLIAEMLDVFRATPYMHVGGDEAYGVSEEIQRDFINRLNEFVKRQGRRTVVWEGPGPGTGKSRVSKDVLHINWRTINFPAQQMLDAGHEVVNAAWDPMYIVDHYPRTMFTAVSLARCYGWNPRRFAHVNAGIPTFGKPHVTKTAEGIVGFCMPWWEGREENLLSLCVPRLAAVASAAWNRSGENDFDDYMLRYAEWLGRLQRISGFDLADAPLAMAGKNQPAGAENLALGGRVRASSGNSQPFFGPARLTNGNPSRFDHFLGYPTTPEPLEIVVELPRPATVARVVVHETAVGKSHELYEVLVASEKGEFELVGSTTPESRGDKTYVEHEFESRRVARIKIRTRGCHGLTFPSFSRLTEVQAFAR